jgi:membrane associated rhomboid family serine protease
MENKTAPVSFNIVILPILFLMAIWLVYWLDWRDYLQLYQYGVYPRTLSGLRGVVFSPFIHGGLRHLYNNSIAIFVLLLMLQYFYKKQVWQVIGWGILLSGLGTWLIARPSYHIGASGLIYVLVSFMFFKGIQSRHFRLVALSLVIVVLYGSMVWYMFPDTEDGISWEGHLSGFATGLLLTLFLIAPEFAQKTYKYDWQHPDFDPQQDPFIKCFDENGNYIIIPKETLEERWKRDVRNPYRITLPVIYTKNTCGFDMV